ncbi:MAG: SusC/RagA family TonB-linked outer membrane protein, partial [Flavobacterium sp.]|nr:SusC/RagA family TonB-linked outer membrane protein [Flavobacterium sp.]
FSQYSVSGADTSQDNLALSGNARRFFDSRLLSYFSRVQYSYDGKYLLSAVIRRDGSSNFGPENKFGFFPTGSVGWIASDEGFLEDSSTINFLKFRASYGIIGNDRIESFRYLSLVNGEGTYVFNNQLTYGQALGSTANPEIRWEKQKPFDVGFDLGLFDKVDITVDYFNKKTEDLLVQPEVSGILGSTAPGGGGPLVNAGTVENEGLEFSINYKETIGEDFKFNINYNFTTLKNEVLYVGSDTGILQGGGFGVGQEPPSRMEAGFPIGYFYGLQTDGLFQNQSEVDSHATQANANPGDIRFIDQNEDGLINGDDRVNIGDPIPSVTMGFNFSFDYKNFDFNMYAFASIGNEIVRNYERNQPLTNRSVYFLDRWTGEGTSTSFPRVTTGPNSNSLFSDFFVEDGSFVRLQNIQFGYTFGENTLKGSGIDKLRFYFSASNLVTLTKYRGFDPTTSNGAPIGGGIDQGFYPSPKTFLIGLNVNF